MIEKTNCKKNPEARFTLNNGVVVDIEVKTPGFADFDSIENIIIPTVLLDEEGRNEFIEYCKQNRLNGALPRVLKLKEFLNSAADKFEDVDHIHRMNLLYINWSLSEFEEIGFEEAFSLLAHSISGALVHKKIGLDLGLKEEVFDKITAVIVYTESLHGLMFDDLRWIWNRGYDGQPHFGIIGMHNCDGLFEVTSMNPYAKQLTPIITGYLRDTSKMPEMMTIIEKHMLRP